MDYNSSVEEENDSPMPIGELIGQVITNIYIIFGEEQDWLDTAECFIELNNTLIIDIPWGFSTSVWIRELDPKAKTIFKDLADYPVYHVNKEGQSIGEIAAAYQKRKKNVFHKLRELFLGKEIIPIEYKPYKVEYAENKLKHVQNRKIIDFLWYDDDEIKGFLLLDNGYVITETRMSPSGTGLAGLNYYDSLDSLTESKGPDFKLLSKETKVG